MRDTLRDAVSPVLSGVIVGLAGGAAAATLMRSLLLGLNPVNPIAFASVAALVGLVSVGACVWPALRVARTDPVTPLRLE
jgi:ABC-type antimicrobial peptide transport system permease subunit